MLDNGIMAQYGKLEYWDDRYSKRTEPFDWYQVYSGMKDIISPKIQKENKILNIGCGNSRMSEEMYEDGYEDITNIDFSNKVISQMEERCKSKYPKMIFKIMDVCEMKNFENSSFNTVIDKGTLDSILCSDTPIPSSEKMLSEIYRILTPGGNYICISYGDSDHRKKYFQKQNWAQFTCEKIIKPATSNNPPDENDPKNYHFIYTMVKP
jgi:ubiquinone/menaquinone biosynthesis C-methylase UbiE